MNKRFLICTLNSKYIHTNLAVRILYQLNKHLPGLSWKEFTIKQEREKIADECSAFELVAFSCYIWNITATLEVCRLLRQRNPTTRILLGGPEVSYDYDDVISCPEVDFIIPGEGEIAFSEFLAAFPAVENVPGLVWKTPEGSVQRNAAPPAFDVRELAALMPYADDEPAILQNKVLYIETSRGCPYKCEFCLASLDNKVRYLPTEAIEKTLAFLMAHGKVIKFLDRTFNIKKDFTIGIFEFILRHHRPGNVFQFEITADILHPDIIRFIEEKVPKSLFRFEIGIQTVNQQANLAVSRKQNFEKTRQIILKLKDRVEMHLDLIVGLPFDRWNDIKRSIEEVFALHPPELQLGFLKFLKGTPVREKHARSGYQFSPSPPYEIISSDFLSAEELEDLRLVEHALEIYWNEGRARHTLRRISAAYSVFDFLLALGKGIRSRLKPLNYRQHEVYDVLLDVIQSSFPNNEQLQEIAVVDYYLFGNTAPQLLYEHILPGLRISTQTLKGPTREKTRNIVLPVSFNYQDLTQKNELTPAKNELLIKYRQGRRPEPDPNPALATTQQD